MFNWWANFGLIFLALIVAGLGWFVIYVLGTIFFDNMIAAPIDKIKKIRANHDRDHYIY